MAEGDRNSCFPEPDPLPRPLNRRYNPLSMVGANARGCAMQVDVKEVSIDAGRRCRALMDAIDRIVTPEQAQKIDVNRYLVTHLRAYGMWLVELHKVLEEEQIAVPVSIYQELVKLGLQLDVGPEYWMNVRYRED
jgi:hypothetical protein